ncbi:MAG: hypothetical protein Q8L81_05980 [Bacteroidota bacterium]|nr:hypothetical protein [Bacteroidota bacterium]
MIKKIKTIAACMITVTILFIGCKKATNGKDGTAGPQGPQGSPGVVATSTDGFITGTILGTRKDGTPFNENFNYTNYWGGSSATLDSISPTTYVISFSRGIDILKQDGAYFTYIAPTLTATAGSISLTNFAFSKTLGTNKEFQFSTTNNTSLSATSLVYNSNTGLFTGNFSGSIAAINNTSGNSATISGSFQVTVTQIYNFIKKGSPVSSSAQ